VILLSDLPGEGCLYFYDSKSSVQHGSTMFVEQIVDMIDVSHFGYSKQQKILQLSYTDHVLFLQFSSSDTMQQWHKKLKKCLCELFWQCKDVASGPVWFVYEDNSKHTLIAYGTRGMLACKHVDLVDISQGNFKKLYSLKKMNYYQ